MKVKRSVSLWISVAGCAILLAGCSFGGGKEPTATPIPPTATVAPTIEPTPAPIMAPTTAAVPSPTAAAAIAGTPVAVNVILTDFRVSAFLSGLSIGTTYSFTIQNNGAATHDFVIEAVGAVNQPLTANGASATVTGIAPGASATLIWTFAEAGTYQFACHQPGHFEQGMVLANVVVTP